MFDVIVTLGLFIVTLGVLVTIHELGHYGAGRLFGLVPDAFSVGMGRALISKADRNGTVWQVGLVPLGGYVRFQDSALGATTPLQRAMIFAAGPLANLLLALLLFSAMVATQPQPSYPPVIGFVATQANDGLRPGDRVLEAGDISIADATTLQAAHRLSGVAGMVRYAVDRDGQALTVLDGPLSSPVITDVIPGGLGDTLGLRPGDRIVSVDGTPSFSVADLVKPSPTGDARTLHVILADAGGSSRTVDLPVAGGGEGPRLGISGQAAVTFETAAPTNPAKWLTGGAQKTWFALKMTAGVIADLIAGNQDTCIVSGPVGMAENVRAAFDRGITIIFAMGAVLSLGLGIFNLIPLPVLDGGQIMVASYAFLFRQEPTLRAYAYLNIIGTLIISTIMVFALLNDFRC